MAQRRQWTVLIWRLADIGLTQLALVLADQVRRALPIGAHVDPDTVYITPAVGFTVAVIWLVVFSLWGLYNGRRADEPGEAAGHVLIAASFSIFTLASFFYFLKIQDFSRILFFYFFVLDLLLLIGLRVGIWSAHSAFDRSERRLRVLILGAGHLRERVVAQIRVWPGYELVGFVDDDPAAFRTACEDVPCLGTFAETGDVVEKYAIDEVILIPDRDDRGRLADQALDLRGQSVRLRVIPDFLELLTTRAPVTQLGSIPVVEVRQPPIRDLNRVLKRALDVVGSTAGLILTAPLMLLIAVLIKLDSVGPVLFVQTRAGQYGNPFRMYKFRSMTADAEEVLEHLVPLDELESPVYKIRNDPRITRVGHWLRRTSLDELPQLFNVLRGDMSLVGPRPEDVRLVRRYNRWQSQRLLVRPGITGAMQISGRGDLPLDERVKLELAYIENYSLWTDIRILIQTIPAVLLGKGAY